MVIESLLGSTVMWEDLGEGVRERQEKNLRS
jgi:hypothetical protein